MAHNKPLAVTMLVVASTTHFAALGDDKTAADRAALQGSWKIIASVVDGNPDDVDRIQVHVVFEGDKRLMKAKTGKTVLNSTFTLDSDKTPKQIDLTTKLNVKNLGEKLSVAHGIYKLDGDMLTLNIGEEGKRPNDFTCAMGSRRSYMVLKRQP